MSPPTSHDHLHPHAATHSHGPTSPHPAQLPLRSILRMTLPARFAAALLLSAVLWAIVLTAMR